MNAMLLAVLLVGVALGVTGCAATSHGGGEAEESITTVVLVRHAEKDAGADPGLAAAGRARAEALVSAVRSALPKGARLDAALATNTRRAKETAAPVARAYGIDVTTTPLGAGLDEYLEDVARMVEGAYAGRNVLVVGHSNTTPELVERLTGAKGLSMTEAEYGRLFIVRIWPDRRCTWEERAYGGG